MQLGSLEEYTECLPAGSADDCQFGLTQSHVNVWKALAASEHGAAWVFECVPSHMHHPLIDLFWQGSLSDAVCHY